MAASNPARSTSTPASRASSSVSSTGKPWVSCRVKATSPPSTLSPVANASSKPAQPGPQRPVEPGLLALEHGEDHVVLLDQRRPGLAQHLGGRLDQHRGHGLVDPEPTRRQHGAPDDAAQHVAPALVGRQDAVGHQHGHGPAVIGHQPQGDVGLLVARRTGRRQVGGGRLDDRREQVGVEDRVVPLQDGEDPLQPGPGVDVLLGQLGPGAVGGPVELHEDQVPDLDVAVLVRRTWARRPRRTPRPLSKKISESGPQGPGVAHGPEVVGVAHALDPLGREAHLVDPDLLGLVVAVVHGDPQAVAVEAEDLGQQLPGHGDGVLLEVVAEAEVAQHLEEGAVVGVGADDLDVEACGSTSARWSPAAMAPARHPTKYGLNGTMPAMVKSTDGSCGIRLAEGTAVCPRSVKKRVKAARSSLASMRQLTGDHLGDGADSAQPAAMPTMGLLRRMPPVEPSNGASPKVKMPPSAATSQ